MFDYDEEEDERRKPLENVHGQEGQGIGVFSVAIAVALAVQFTPLREVRDDVQNAVKTYVAEQFNVAVQSPKPKHNCLIVAANQSSSVGCTFDRK